MADYSCPDCYFDFGYPQGLSIHKELGCEGGPEDDFDLEGIDALGESESEDLD